MAFDLERFVAAQEPVRASVMAELSAGRKRSHWMWFVFPQLAGLGMSAMSQRYAIGSRDEAAAYLAHPALGTWLIACTQVVLGTQGSAHAVFGDPDTAKFRSCMTLFAAVPEANSVFSEALERFFGGVADSETVRLLG